MLASTACSTGGDATPTDGNPSLEVAESAFPSEGAAIAIVTSVEASGPLGGTFVVEEGATTLGCSSGAYEDSGWGPGHRKVFTCDAGEMTGTFAVNVHPDSVASDPGPPERWTGTWGIDGSASTGDFEGLQGFGVFEVVFDARGRPETETLSGQIFG
jgi:hypothetical protein